MNSQQKKLYRQIKELPITPADNGLTFEGRLARENGWDVSMAILVDQEYRKFLFLMLEAGHPVTPSDEVDQAWHLHLLYTESYWDDLCGRIAGRPLHHGPTAGGSAESAKYVDWYRATLESYRRLFGSEPPADVWPCSETRFADADFFRRVNTRKYFLVTNPINRIRVILKQLVSRRK